MTRRFMALVGIPYLWLVLFFVAPFLIVLKISLSDGITAMPPYTPVLDLGQGLQGLRNYVGQLDLENYLYIFEESSYAFAYVNSLRVALISTLACLLFGYPIAYAMASAPARFKPTLILLINLPFWTSFLVRIYAWIVLLSKEGVVNNVLKSLGLIDEPLVILNTTFAVYLGMVYAYIPLMIFPIYATLEKLDTSVYEAARDLGCSRIGAFFRVTLPMSKPGILAGVFLVFIPATGEFVVPSLLGSAQSPMIGRLLWEEFFINNDWPMAAAISVLLLAILVLPVVFYQAYQQKVHREQS
ncbi:putrescine transport system permease protein [Rhizobium sp. SG_E_25_P2]|uniref:ABC transporter permease n=1 Tax=Rhizobium sp. SG_E_25_P2 TaxID=2879942 RepID=UPI0024762225|nr:ABC transporter permease subunit [Rhizobium sp. SG_E_25_P2]MDH6265977.1 putrescine transport system permease protein [Rhizobium sp. SG_E_25_P2]